MPTEESPDTPQTEGQTQGQSLAQQNPNPIMIAAAFVGGVVIGRIASRR
jgi:hypothetical protein